METTSHDSDEISTVLINTVEALSKKVDKLEDLLKRNNDLKAANNIALQELKTTITDSNKIFEQVSQGVKDLYDKVRGLEILSKLAGNINLGSLLGGLGNITGGQKK